MNQLKKQKRPRYSEVQATKWLSWMADNMQKHNQTVFLIEQLQVSWLPKRLEKLAHLVLSLNFEAMIFGLVAGLFGIAVTREPVDTLLIGLIAALGGVVVGLIFSVGRKKESIEMTGRLTWSWKYFRKNSTAAFKTGFLRGLLIGFILGLFLSIIPSLREGLIIKGAGWKMILMDKLMIMMIAAVIGGLIGMISMGLKNTVPELTIIPNEGIRRSLRTGLKRGIGWGVIAWVIGGLFFSLSLRHEDWLFLGMILGLIVGLPMGAFRGFMAGSRHYTLRILIYILGYGPWNYANFLDFVVDELHFMQRVGGGYIFIHRMLLEHFAAMEEEKIVTINGLKKPPVTAAV